MRKLIKLSIISTSAIFILTAQAVEFKLLGQVSRMVVMPDDAQGDEVQFQDIDWSGSRFRFTGSQDLASDYKFGFRLEQQLQSNSAGSSAGGGQVNGGNDDAIDYRYQRYLVFRTFW